MNLLINLVNQADRLLSHADKGGESLSGRARQVIDAASQLEKRVDSVSSKVGSMTDSIQHAFATVAEGYRFSSEYSKRQIKKATLTGAALLGIRRVFLSSLSSVGSFLPLSLILPFWILLEIGKFASTYHDFLSFKEQAEAKDLTELSINGEKIDLVALFFDSEKKEEFLTNLSKQPAKAKPSVQPAPQQPAKAEAELAQNPEPIKPVEAKQVNWAEEFQQGNVDTLAQAWQEIQHPQRVEFTQKLAQNFEQAWINASSQNSFQEVFEQVWIRIGHQASFETVWAKIQQDQEDLIAEFEQFLNSGDTSNLSDLKSKVENNEMGSVFATIVHEGINARVKVEEERRAEKKKVDQEIEELKHSVKNTSEPSDENDVLESLEKREKALESLKSKVKDTPEGLSPYALSYREEQLKILICDFEADLTKIKEEIEEIDNTINEIEESVSKKLENNCENADKIRLLGESIATLRKIQKETPENFGSDSLFYRKIKFDALILSCKSRLANLNPQLHSRM